MKLRQLIGLGVAVLASCTFAAPPEFFAFDNGVGRGKWTPEQQAQTLKELGYDGISYNYTNNKDLETWIRVYREHGLKIYGLYIYTFPDKPEAPYPSAFKDAIKLLKGSDTVIWMTLREGKDRKRNLDQESVAIVRDLADQAAAQGLRVAVYPHAGFYVGCATDAVRIVKLADRPNVGASINLCHEFVSKHGDRIDETVQQVAPLAYLASINGMTVAQTNYFGRLDQGDFDQAAYLHKLQAAGYKGPIGWQGFRVDGEPRENLRLTMEAWKRIAK